MKQMSKFSYRSLVEQADPEYLQKLQNPIRYEFGTRKFRERIIPGRPYGWVKALEEDA